MSVTFYGRRRNIPRSVPNKVNEQKPNLIQPVQALGMAGKNIYKGIDKMKETELLNKGYLNKDVFSDEAGFGLFNRNTDNVGFLKKPFRTPEERVNLSRAGKNFFNKLAEDNQTNVVEAYTNYMTDHGVSSPDLRNIAKGSFNTKEIIDSPNLYKSINKFANWDNPSKGFNIGNVRIPKTDFFKGTGFGFNKPTLPTFRDPFSLKGGMNMGDAFKLKNPIGGVQLTKDNILGSKIGVRPPAIDSILPGLNPVQPLSAGLGNPFQGLQAGMTQAFPALGATPGLAMAMPIIGGIGVLGSLLDWW